MPFLYKLPTSMPTQLLLNTIHSCCCCCLCITEIEKKLKFTLRCLLLLQLLLLLWHLYSDAVVNADVKQLLLPLLLLLFLFSLFSFLHYVFVLFIESLIHTCNLHYIYWNLHDTEREKYKSEIECNEIHIRNNCSNHSRSSQSAAQSAEAAQNATAATEVVKPDFLFGRLLCSCCCCLLHFIFDSY